MQNVFNQAGMSLSEYLVAKALNYLPMYQQWAYLPVASGLGAQYYPASLPLFPNAAGCNPFTNNPDYQVRQQILQTRMSSLHAPRSEFLPVPAEPTPKPNSAVMKFDFRIVDTLAKYDAQCTNGQANTCLACADELRDRIEAFRRYSD